MIENGNVVVDAVGQHAGILLIGPNAGNIATLSIAGGWLSAAEGVEVGSDTGEGALVIDNSGTLFAPIVTVGALGQLNGSGEIVGNVVNDGVVSPGMLNITGNFAQNAGGILKLGIDSVSSYDQLAIGGSLMAGGTLEIDLLSFAPVAGNTFDLFDFSTSMGSFALELPSLTGGLAWDSSNLLTTGELSVVASVVENADFDSDGDVDGNDFLVWQRGFGSPGSLTSGDANGDGNVDALDLGIWQTQYGNLASLATAEAVPEPAAFVLLCCCLFIPLTRNRANQ